MLHCGAKLLHSANFMGRPAARFTDLTSHGTPMVPGTGSLNVLIGYLPAWRGIPLAAAAGVQGAQSAADATVKAAETATKAAAGTPGAPAAYAAEQAAKAAALASVGATMMAFAPGSDIHICPIPTPVPPHGPGVVIDGSATVMINNMPACTQGCTILEALGGPDKIAKGEMTVLIGDSGGGGGSGGGSGGGGAAGKPGSTGAGASAAGAPGAGGEGPFGQAAAAGTSAPPQDMAAQVGTLKHAAADGTPFCEICAKMAAERAAAAKQ